MQAAVGAQQLRERQQVGREQLRELAPLLHDGDDRVLVAQLREHLRVGGVAGLAAPPGRQRQPLEEHLAELLGRAEHERPAGQLLGLLLERLDLLRDARGDLPHARRVDRDPGALHRAQHGDERQLDVLHQRAQLALVDARGQRAVQQQRPGGAAGEHGVAVAVGAGHREALLGEQVVEVVLAAARIDQVGGQLGVEGGRDAGLAERAAELLEGVRDDRRVAAREHGRRVALGDQQRTLALGDAEQARAVAGHADRPAGLEQGAQRLAVAALGSDRVLLALDRGARHGRLELVDAPQQGAELEAAEQLAHRRAVGRVGERTGEVDVERQVALDGRQQLRALRLLAVLDQHLPALVAGHRIDVRVDALERAEAHEQVGRRLVADAGDARDVVRGVALEADEVGYETRRDAVARLHAVGRVDVHVGHAARREQHADVLGHQLEGVAVVGDHAGRDPLLVRAQAERADHVVGLVALVLDVAVAERLDQRAQVRLLLLEQRRRRLARRLVAGKALEPVHGPRVPRDDHALGVVVGEQPHEHVREAEQRVRREPVGRRELLGQRVVGPVGERVAVDEEQPGRACRAVAEIESEGFAGTRAS